MSLICSNPKLVETKGKLPENIFVVVLYGGALQHGISLPLGKMAPVCVHLVRYFLLCVLPESSVCFYHISFVCDYFLKNIFQLSFVGGINIE